MKSMRSMRSVPVRFGLGAAAMVSALVLSACSGATDEPAAVPDGADPAMVALCDEMVGQGMSPDEADALAVDNGYVTRVGSVDGEPQAVTMDYRTDRFTLEIVKGVVTACQYG